MIFDKNKLIKSPLNYTGGKFKLLPQLLPLFPDNINTFIDLFCGGCNVGINVKANKIICNDSMKQLIDLYKYFQSHTIEDIYKYIYDMIDKYELTKTNQMGYLKMREQYNKYKNPIDLYVCICYSFNNQIRFNSKGEFNMPFGKNRSSFNSALQDRLKIFIRKIENIIFLNKSFEELKVDKLNNNDFIYCDPPYLVTRASYNENNGWNENNEKMLLNLLDELNQKNIKFALSNVLENKGKSNDLLKEWSKKYNVHILSNDYSNCNYHTKNRDKNSTIEVLITNY